MKNFAKNSGNRKLWGVLGKQQEYYSPSHFQKEKTPLNSNPLEAWDYKKSKYKRVDLVPRQLENDGQQAGVVPQTTATPDVSPTHSPLATSTPSPTPSFTPTQTMTPTVTPSSTPYILPETPALWYDATNVGSIDYITSGGTNYVSNWRSIGTYSKMLTGTTTDTMPQWSASTTLPGSPLVVRFTKSATAGLRDFLSQRFDSTVIPTTGITQFIVITNPSYNYSATSTTNGFGIQSQVFSGNTTTGGFTPISSAPPVAYNTLIGALTNNVQLGQIFSGYSVANIIGNFSSTTLGNKFLYTQIYPLGTFPYFEINQSGGTNTTSFTGTSPSSITSIVLGSSVNSGGTIGTTYNSGAELAEWMIFNRVLTPSEQEQVQNYLKDKWRYDEWASPVPTATPTGTPAATPTPSPTTTNTPTPSITPSQPAFSPSSISELRTWYDANDATTITKRTGTDFIEVWQDKSGNNYHLTQSTASAQPLFTGGTSVASWSGNTYVYFDGGDYVSRTTGTSFSDSGFTYFYVARMNDSSSSNSLVFNYTDQAPPVNVGKYRAYQGTATFPANRSLTLGADNNFMRFDWASPSTSLGGKNQYQYGWVSGTTAGAFSGSVNDIAWDASGSAGTIPDSIAAISLGANNDGGAPIIGYVAEVIVYGKVLSTTEKNNVETYLKNKWGYNTW